MAGFFFVVCFIAAVQGLNYYGQKTKRHRAYSAVCPLPPISKTDIVFHGSQTGLSDQELHLILLKRYAYYSLLDLKLRQRFIKRLRTFMNGKLFIIKDDEGYREMPVLVSAAAVQLTFGLRFYRFPFYKYIRIYPEEYVASHSFNILTGTVQDNCITVAWNHLLKGYKNTTDGQNVGLHEMSHALYIQKMVIEENYARKFAARYQCVTRECDQAFNLESKGSIDLYSAYANTNLQEFWAESIELFFEKPEVLNSHYPGVFEALKLLLNQDPRTASNPILKKDVPALAKLIKVSRLLPGKKF